MKGVSGIDWIHKSPWVFIISTGTCNGCEIEILAAKSPLYDFERLGCLHKKSPRHADIVIITGCGSEKVSKRAERVLQQVPDPKVVVAIGACALNGGVFKGKHRFKADICVPGCPPRPAAILKGVKEAVELVKGSH